MSRLLALCLVLLLGAAGFASAQGDAGGDTPATSSNAPSTTVTAAPQPVTTKQPTTVPETTKQPATTVPTTQASTAPTDTPKQSTVPTTQPTTVPTTQPSTDATDTSKQPTVSTVPPVPPATTKSVTTLQPASTTTIKINFINDLHYQLFPFSSDATACSISAATTATAPTATDNCLGGLTCLAAKQVVDHTKALWLHSGVGLGYGDDGQYDYHRLLKGTTASEAFKLLNFDALSVDADLFRYGTSEGTAFVDAVTDTRFSCANCDGLLPKVKKYTVLPSTAPTQGCSVAVIGVMSSERATKGVLNKKIKDEIVSIKEAVAAIKTEVTSKLINVVIGEMTEELAKDIVDQVKDVHVVLYSGNKITDAKAGYKMAQSTAGQVYASLVASSAAKDEQRVGVLNLDVDSDCKPLTTSSLTVVPYTTKTKDCSTGDVAVDKQMLTLTAKILETVDQASKAVGKAVLTMDSQPCSSLSCALGQLVADGVRTLVNQKVASWSDGVRGVLLPADVFSGSLDANKTLTLDSVLAVFKDDPMVCKTSLTGTQLWDLVSDLVSYKTTFPQLSGVWVDYDPNADVKLERVWLQTDNLLMAPLDKTVDATYIVAMPCTSLESRGISGESESTGVALSQGLLWHLRDTQSVLVPPVVDPRLRISVGPASATAFCEDWTALTVAYTLLVLGALSMIGYQGYQFWRFRSTLSYVR